jgi:ComF family protein
VNPPSVMRRPLGHWLHALGDALLPPACPACDGVAGPASASWVCTTCRLKIKPLSSPKCDRCWAPLGTGGVRSDNTESGQQDCCTECERWPAVLTRVRSATALEGPARTLVHRLKYHGWETLAPAMARYMIPLAGHCPKDWIVPVPTTPWRRRLRGYNQAERIATALAAFVETPMLDALIRTGSSGTQVALQPLERLANVNQAFSLREECRSRLSDSQVVLVDDVLTTGATAAAAVTVMRNSGVRSIQVLTFARALPVRGALG